MRKNKMVAVKRWGEIPSESHFLIYEPDPFAGYETFDLPTIDLIQNGPH